MTRFTKNRRKKLGLSLETPAAVGETKRFPTRVRIMEYTESSCEERDLASIHDAFPLKERPVVKWINIDGLEETPVIEALGEHFGVHPLIIEDILTLGQRPKLEDHEDYLYIVLRMLRLKNSAGEIDDEQVSFLLGLGWVVSVQETERDVFDPLRERIRTGKGRIRKTGAGYLAYALVDAIVNHYFVVLERLGDRVDALAERLVTDPGPETLHELQAVKHELLFLRKWIWPLREVISGMYRSDSHLFTEQTRAYLRDVYDHAVQVMDAVETYRDMVSGMLEIYVSSQSNRLNEVMKVLTIIATIFMPLSFLASLYGMNFQHMPELHWRFGYFAVLGVMAVAACGMLLYFKKKKWL